MSDHHYLFVDGAYLRMAAERISAKVFDDLPVFIDADRLTSGFARTFYYDCLPVQRAKEDDGEFNFRHSLQENVLHSMELAHNAHVVRGTVSGQGDKVRQKKIDVSIAVHMLTHSHRKNMARATLLAGDLDFKPLVDALVNDGTFVTLWFDPSSASQELIRAADTRQILNAQTLYQIASDQLAKDFPRPQVSQTGPQERGSPPLRTGITSYYESVRVWQAPNYMLYELEGSEEVVNRFTTYTHQDPDFLDRFVQHLRGDITWQPATSK